MALDFGLEASGASWVITCGEYRFPGKELSGPHYAPLDAYKGASLARINIAGVIDSERLLADLRSLISNPAIRHKGDEIVPYLLGTTREDRVTCSSLIGRAILRQDSQPLAQALRQALKERYTYGEISPADLARAAAILNLSTEEVPARRIQSIPILKRREPAVHVLE